MKFCFCFPNSTFNFTRRLLSIRRDSTVLRAGGIRNIEVVGDVLSFERFDDSNVFRVMVNFSDAPVTLGRSNGRVVLSSVLDSVEGWIQANEAVVREIAP